MARTTRVLAVSLPPDLVREYEALARRLRKNKSELFREMWAAFKTVRTRPRSSSGPAGGWRPWRMGQTIGSSSPLPRRART